jgi:hypothetical protein
LDFSDPRPRIEAAIRVPIDPRYRYAWVRIIAGATVFETVIVLGILGLAAFLGGKIGYLLGARRATNEIANIFKREVALTDDDLKALDALARRRTLLDDGSLGEIARILHVAAWNEFMDEQERTREPKPGESSVTMTRR